jgi:hypothetical protein
MEANGAGGSRVFDLREGHAELREAIHCLGLDATPVLSDILDMVEQMKATSALLEAEYVDPDYRDEYVNYYAFTYRPLQTRCKRLHFFLRTVREERTVDHYLGFCVLRPIRDHPVCRTMIVPPDDLWEYVSCTVRADLHPMGKSLRVKGFPFMEQDSQYARCAHASVWMVALYHHLQHGNPRRLMSDITRGAALRSEIRRTAPSDGLSIPQVGAALQHLELDPIVYSAKALKELKVSISAAACRYLNSGMPVIVATEGHATVLIGYGRDENGRVFFVRSDESQGPYQWFYKGEDPLGDWILLLVAHPGKIYLSGEAAEVCARDIFRVLVRERTGDDPGEDLGPSLRVRTYVTRAGAYKARMAQRGLPETLQNVCFGIGTPTWIWVVELQDVEHARQTRECVVGEIAFDATSSSLAPGPLFGSYRGTAYSWPSPRKTLKHVLPDDAATYLSGTIIHDAPTGTPKLRTPATS